MSDRSPRNGHGGVGWLVALTGMLAVVTACGGTSGSSTATTAAATTSAAASPSASASSSSTVAGTAPGSFEGRCGTNVNLAQPLPVPFTFTTADGVTLLGAEFGTGAKGVVALHELGRGGLCDWAPYAQYLAGKGLHVLVFDHRCIGRSTCPTGAAQGNSLADIAAARAELLRRGATTTALLGASQGGGEAIAAAGSQPGWSRAAVLSGAVLTTDFGGGVTATSAMLDVTAPVLFLVDDNDGDSPLAADQALVATAKPGVVTFTVLPAEGNHGVTMLQSYPGAPWSAAADQVAAFLAG